MHFSKMALYAVALRLLFLLHQTLQLALCIRACSILLAFVKPRFIHQTAR
uniref:Uncharacterized protein n=1 Tax=Anguilla anguilla TaxID=7936 RepID=A0A0E9VS08_ANGAN